MPKFGPPITQGSTYNGGATPGGQFQYGSPPPSDVPPVSTSTQTPTGAGGGGGGGGVQLHVIESMTVTDPREHIGASSVFQNHSGR